MREEGRGKHRNEISLISFEFSLEIFRNFSKKEIRRKSYEIIRKFIGILNSENGFSNSHVKSSSNH